MAGEGDDGYERGSFDRCEEVTPLCPVEATVLGYHPNLGASIFFAIAFGACLVAALYLGVRSKTWTFTVAITLGLILETAGYVGRALLYYNPWNSGAFQLQICAIILAPTMICVSIYLTLKHVALNLSAASSRIRPKWYPIIFLPADVSCLLVQAIGGAIAASADRTDFALLRSGNNAIIAGVALQVVVLLAFGIMGADYWFRVRRHMATGNPDPASLALWRAPKFRKFGYAVAGAYASVLIRCIYRIAEMAGGWGNHIMQDEASFMVLDTALMAVAVYLLTIFHPALYFPQMASAHRSKKEGVDASAGEEHTLAETSESNTDAGKVEVSQKPS
jgi:hypothetical protein